MRFYSIALLVTGAFLVNVERAPSFQHTAPDYPTVLTRSFADHQNSGAPKRLLRHYREGDEERAIGGGAISELATKFKGGASNLAKKFVGINKYEAQLANKLDPISVYNALTAPRLTTLTADVEKINSNNFIKKVSVIGILTARYGDDSLAKALTLIKTYGSEDRVLGLLTAGKSNGHTADLLENSLLSKWAGENHSPKTVFQKLKLHLHADDAFAADQLNNIVKYVDDFNTKNSLNKKSTLDLYTSSFGDATVAQNLVSAVRNPLANNVAKELQTQQLKGWINNGKSVDDMFTILKIEKRKGATSWQLDVLEKFISLKSGEQNVIKTLTEKFGGNNKLAIILERASKSTGTTTLQEKQFTALIRKEIRPENFMSSVFRTVPASATREQEAIAAKFERIYRTSKSTETTTLQKKQFIAWLEKDVKPENFMSSVFKTSVTSATKEQKSIEAKVTVFTPILKNE
ncbi:Secreted RxLR effector peptide protein [Phytophthora palmivora]|uniref:Secreted RxLR effector peptide protein n=1 Tax=Phytophthora palmivora TaxID=4796 RepID=A0A2P4YCH3_9STRA|nr:Secreted RxLR effector peptide protein [Phytophthora palmivora]